MQKLKITISYILGGIVLLGVVAVAGSLTPQAPVGSTMKTMEDVYQKLTLNTYTPVDHDISTTSSPTEFGTMHSLADIWDAIPTIQADTIATGTSVMGIDGNLVIPTESQVESGVTFGPNNSLTGTLLAGTQPTQFSTAEYGDYTDWNAGGTFCANLVEGGHDDWRLPTYTELVDASPGGDNPVGGFQNDKYWSGTTYPYSADRAYYVSMYVGSAGYGSKANPLYLVRCAR